MAASTALVSSGQQLPLESTLNSLSELIHSKAEVFASPSTSYATAGGNQMYADTLKATKYLFDASLQGERESLNLFSKLLEDIRESSYTPKIETRSKAAHRQGQQSDIKGKGKASNPLFRPTQLHELYIDTTNDTSTSSSINGESNNLAVASSSNSINSSKKSLIDSELELQMIWEQLEQRNEKVLQIIKEIVHDGDDVDSDDENGMQGGEDDDGDSDEDEFGLEGEDDDEEMMQGMEDEEDDEGQDLYDGTDSEEEEDHMEDDQSMEEEDEEEAPPLRKLAGPYFAKLRDASSSPPPTKKQGSKKAGSGSKEGTTTTVKPESAVDDGLFSLKDFNNQVLEGEDEMKRYISSGKSKSINDLKTGIDGLEDLDDSDNEEIDYFATDAGDIGLGSDDDDEDEDEEEEDGGEDDGMRPEDMRYLDFWAAPSKVFTRRKDDDYAPQKGGKNFKGKGKPQKPEPKGRQWNPSIPAEPTPSTSSTAPTTENGKETSEKTAMDTAKSKKDKRRVSFHDQVKVQEIEPTSGPQSSFAQLVRSVGTKEALRRLKEGEFQDDQEAVDEDDEVDEEEDDENDGEDMTEEEMQALLDGEYGSSDEGEEGSEEEEEEDNDDMSQASDESIHKGAMTMRRLQKDLLSEDDAEDSSSTSITKRKSKGQQSRYESRMQALSEQISALEAENVSEREWTMKGEVNSRSRPQNSLLEEDLEFDQAAKVVPIVTEESSLSLEDMIKKRILEDRFDDVVRKSVVEAAAYIPSRLLDIKDTQNERSLADIYADEFSAERRRTNGEEAETPEIDTKLQKEHESIKSIFDEICNKLDSLSNAHFTPQIQQTTISTISNTPSISMESAMPLSMSTSSGLAPEEIYAPEQNGTLTAKSEMTPSQKKAARAKARKARMQTQKVIDKYGGKSRNDKQAKERAMNSLIGKRGVTVVGKGKAAKSALTGQERRVRGSGPDTSGMSGAKFKL